MSKFKCYTAKYGLLFTSVVIIFSSALVEVTRTAHRRPLLCVRSTTQSQSGPNDHATKTSFLQKSPESNFWIAINQKDTPSSPTSDIPAIPRLDCETGRLPPGAYHNIDIDDGNNVISPCLIAVGIQPPLNANDGKDVWREGVRNCQKHIDSGFNTFRVNNSCEQNKKKKYGRRRQKSPSSIAWENAQQRTFQTENGHQAETKFYHTLRQNTPLSVLRSCHFMVNLEIPSILSEDSVTRGSEKELSPVSFGNGWMVRESVSSALMRTKQECLNSVILEYRNKSPYHLDVLDTLFDLKREGLIQSISTRNFPPSLLQSALGSGFSVHSNDVCGNLMHTHNLRSDGKMGLSCNDHGCSRLVSAPLGGGLFTNQYGQFQEWVQLSASNRKKFDALLLSCCNMRAGEEFDSIPNWKRYRTIMDTLGNISFKHQVSVESVALRWILQLNGRDSISVGTQLGMDFVEEQGGQPYHRHRNLRQVFTFSLESDDMQRLCKVSGFSSERRIDTNHEIDFANKALWI